MRSFYDPTTFWPRHEVFKDRTVRAMAEGGAAILYFDRGRPRRFVHPRHRAADRANTNWLIEGLMKRGEVVVQSTTDAALPHLAGLAGGLAR